MYSSAFVTQLLVEERMKDAMRRSEQIRLIRAAEGPGKPWTWQLSMILVLKGALALFIRPQRERLSANTPNL